MPADQRRFLAQRNVLGAVFVAAIFAMGLFFLVGGYLIPWPMADKFGWLFLLFGAVAAWDWWATSYSVEQEQLVIRSALSKDRIALCNIEDVQVRSGALKLKCQKLRGSRWVTLIPCDKDELLNLIYTKCPWLR